MGGFRVAWRALSRDWRSGELHVLVLALIVAVASVSAVTFFADRVQRAMQGQAAELLGADLVLVSSSPIRELFADEARNRGLQVVTTVDFPSVILANEDTLLVQVKAVTSGYPLRGALRVSERPRDPGATTQNLPGAGEIWADSRVLDHFKFNIGHAIGLGEGKFLLTKVIAFEPDRGSQLFRLAPRVLIRMDNLQATGLVSATSRVRYKLLLAGPAHEIAAYRVSMESQLLPGEAIQGVRDGRPELRNALERAEQYLRLAALVAVMVAGAAIALSARRYAQRQTDASAIMRCLGASRRLILQLYVWRLLIVGIAASVIGCVGGYIAQAGLSQLLEGWFVEDAQLPGLDPILIGLGTGLITLGGFALPPILKLQHISPLRVLRRDMGTVTPSGWLTTLSVFLAMGGLLLWHAGNTQMMTRMLGGAVTMVLLLWLASWGLLTLLNRFKPRSRVAWRYGVSRLMRRKSHSVLQISGFTVGVSALLMLAIARVDLLEIWQEGLPDDAPNHFLINIQSDQKDAVATFLEQRGLSISAFYPIIRARLIAINGQQVNAENYDNPRAKRLLGREFNLTWSDQLQSDNKIEAGRWWGKQGSEIKAFSIESGIAKTLGIDLGDHMHFHIAGVEVQAEVTSVREVDWDSFNPNFFVIASSALLRDRPANLITSFYLPADEDRVIPELAAHFPSVTAIDIGVIMQQVRHIMDRAALAIEFIFLFTLLAGLLVMVAAIQAGQDERRQETSLMRALGATRRQVMVGLLSEFMIIGIVTGVFASAIASIAGYFLATQVFGLVYTPNPWLWAWGIAGSSVVICSAGLLGTYRLLNQSPLLVLRRT